MQFVSDPIHERTARLRKDILNAGAHVFGQHVSCDQYFCRAVQVSAAAARAAAAAGPSAAGSGTSSGSTPAPGGSCAPSTSTGVQAEENYVPRLQKSGLWNEIMVYLNRLADNANSLIHNVNNNMCEVANGVTAKFLNGKRIMYSGRNSFNIRCSAAALSLNTSGQLQRVVHKTMQNGSSPGKLF